MDYGILLSSLTLFLAFLLSIGESQTLGRVQCYSCFADLTRETYRLDHPCLFPNDVKDRVICSENSRFCQVEVTRVGGALATLDRRCSADCQPKCLERGFGIVRRICTYCCQDNPACDESAQ